MSIMPKNISIIDMRKCLLTKISEKISGFFYFLKKLVKQLILGNAAQNFAVGKQNSLALSAGDSEISLRGLTGTVYNASHNGNRHFFADAYADQSFFEFFAYMDQINFRSSAGGTGNDIDEVFI